jgi:hypothetical protein
VVLPPPEIQTTLERSLRANRRRLEREVRSLGRDLYKQSGTLTTRVEKAWGDAQSRISSIA